MRADCLPCKAVASVDAVNRLNDTRTNISRAAGQCGIKERIDRAVSA